MRDEAVFVFQEQPLLLAGGSNQSEGAFKLLAAQQNAELARFETCPHALFGLGPPVEVVALLLIG